MGDAHCVSRELEAGFHKGEFAQAHTWAASPPPNFEWRPMLVASRRPAPHEVLHVDAAVRVDNASTCAVAQAMPKLEEGAAPCGFVVAVGAVVSGAAETTRCRRRTSGALSEFTLPDFPPGKCEVLTPRQDPEMDDT